MSRHFRTFHLVTVINVGFVCWLLLVAVIKFPGYRVMDPLYFFSAAAATLLSVTNASRLNRVPGRASGIFTMVQVALLQLVTLAAALFGPSSGGYHDMGKLFYILACPVFLLLSLFLCRRSMKRRSRDGEDDFT